VIAALIAALMSTISTHLNWGSSYIVNDIYQRFVKPDASEKEMVFMGRISTVVLMILAALFSLMLSSALEAFEILLSIGAGTGLLFILRWFWWRINAISEIVAMVVSFIIALIMKFGVGDAMLSHEKLVLSVLLTTIAWVSSTLLTKPTNVDVLINFYKKIRPHNFGWQPVINAGHKRDLIDKYDTSTGRLSTEILMMFLGCIGVYALLFGMGYILYGQTTYALLAIGIALSAGWFMKMLWAKISW
jgi:uncharacterized sodium:solute symporter family permease YidK